MLAQKAASPELNFRRPTHQDGPALFQLIKSCPPLDQNSRYCNLLQCSHFAETSALALDRANVLAAATGYIVPDKPDTLFIWQIAVNEALRGQRVAKRLIDSILDRPVCENVRFIETTITESNQASWSVFRKIAEHFGVTLSSSPLFDEQDHFDGEQDSEQLVRIGPITFPHHSQNSNQSLSSTVSKQE